MTTLVGQKLRDYAAAAENERMQLLAEGRIREQKIPEVRASSVKALVSRLRDE